MEYKLLDILVKELLFGGPGSGRCARHRIQNLGALVGAHREFSCTEESETKFNLISFQIHARSDDCRQGHVKVELSPFVVLEDVRFAALQGRMESTVEGAVGAVVYARCIRVEAISTPRQGNVKEAGVVVCVGTLCALENPLRIGQSSVRPTAHGGRRGGSVDSRIVTLNEHIRGQQVGVRAVARRAEFQFDNSAGFVAARVLSLNAALEVEVALRTERNIALGLELDQRVGVTELVLVLEPVGVGVQDIVKLAEKLIRAGLGVDCPGAAELLSEAPCSAFLHSVRHVKVVCPRSEGKRAVNSTAAVGHEV